MTDDKPIPTGPKATLETLKTLPTGPRNSTASGAMIPRQLRSQRQPPVASSSAGALPRGFTSSPLPPQDPPTPSTSAPDDPKPMHVEYDEEASLPAVIILPYEPVGLEKTYVEQQREPLGKVRTAHKSLQGLKIYSVLMGPKSCQIAELERKRLKGLKQYTETMRMINAGFAEYNRDKLEMDSIKRRRVALAKQHDLAKQGILGIGYPGDSDAYL
jgi:hypothetical protein